MYVLRKQGRPTPQFAFSERDANYLETQGWVRDVLSKPAHELADKPETQPPTKKRGRPYKAK